MALAPDRRRALLALLWVAPAPSLGVLLALHLTPGTTGSVAWTLSKLWLLLAPPLWQRFEGRPWSWSPVRRGGIGQGLALGLGMAAAVGASYLAFGRGQIDADHLRRLLGGLGLTDPARYLALSVYWTLANSLAEEMAFRWFLFSQCERLMPARRAQAAAAGLFTLHHVLALAAYLAWWQTLLASLGVFVAGLLWSGLYRRYRSIWVPYLSHVLADLAVFAVGWDILYGFTA